MTDSSEAAAGSPSLGITRLNGDSTWLIEIDGTRLLLDPWLEGPARLVHPLLHVARLGAPAVPIEDLPAVDALIVSHPFPDHCNATTLRKLRRDLPVYAPRVVRPWVRALGGFRRVGTLANCTRQGSPTAVGNATLAWCRAKGALDTTHNALIIRGSRSGATVAYCPHGLLPPDPTFAAVERHLGGRLDVLLCSFTLLDLPWYFAGVANLGKEAGVALVERLRPRYVLRTHDGEKPDSGFIARVEKIDRCTDVAAALAGRAPGSVPVEPATGEMWQPA